MEVALVYIHPELSGLDRGHIEHGLDEVHKLSARVVDGFYKA